MKKTLHIFTIVTLIAAATFLVTACNRSPEKSATERVLSATDTTGLAAFQAWKIQNENKQLYYVPVSQAAPAVYKAPARKASTPAATQPVAKKKGWSKAAKGAVIGTSAGAIAGAVINKKNRVLGGVIGGVVGGGIGYGIGRGMDKKDGRY